MSAPTLPAETRRILELARGDRAAARKAMAGLTLEAQVALVCETPVGRRAEILGLADGLEALVPALPEAELCYTAKAIGIEGSYWILAHATPEQLVACLDLDAWTEQVPSPATIGSWIATLAEAGEESLLAASRAIDPELLVLWLAERVQVEMKPPVSEADAWEPPAGAATLEGQFYLLPRGDEDDLADALALLQALFRHDYWRYFRLVQGVEWELRDELEEWAHRWRAGRLLDLGFPTWDEAIGIYALLPASAIDALPADDALGVGEWPLPIWMPRLPISSSARESLFRGLAGLTEEERRERLYAFLALANRVAVADRLPLGDAETIPKAMARVTLVAGRGLDHLAAVHGVGEAEVLRRASLERLFRIGFSLAPDRGPEAQT